MLRMLGGLVLFQIGLRLWLRLWPRPIPYGWSWLLENPWRRLYRSPERTAALCALQPSDTVLELGCGSGFFSRALALRCARLVVSDLSARYLGQTWQRTRDLSNVEYLHADMLRLPLPDASVDAVLLLAALTEVARPVQALRECARVLRPGGKIVVSEELFAPEYVPARVTERWATAAGLTRSRASGNAWVYFHHYTLA